MTVLRRIACICARVPLDTTCHVTTLNALYFIAPFSDSVKSRSGCRVSSRGRISQFDHISSNMTAGRAWTCTICLAHLFQSWHQCMAAEPLESGSSTGQMLSRTLRSPGVHGAVLLEEKHTEVQALGFAIPHRCEIYDDGLQQHDACTCEDVLCYA
jgi:hypothetical protein